MTWVGERIDPLIRLTRSMSTCGDDLDDDNQRPIIAMLTVTILWVLNFDLELKLDAQEN